MELPKQGVIGGEFRYCGIHASKSAMNLAIRSERGIEEHERR